MKQNPRRSSGTVQAVCPFPPTYPEDGCILTLTTGEEVQLPWGESPVIVSAPGGLIATLYTHAPARALFIPDALAPALLSALGLEERGSSATMPTAPRKTA